MATQYAYHRFVLQSTKNLFERKGNPESCDANISRQSRRSRKRRRKRERQKYCATILRALPCWGRETKKRAELMNELRSYWKNKWSNETIPEIKKVILEITLIPEDVINIIQKYYEYPYQTKPAYMERICWFQDSNGMWRRYDHRGRMECTANTLVRRRAMWKKRDRLPGDPDWEQLEHEIRMNELRAAFHFRLKN